MTPKSTAAAGLAICGALDAGADMPAIAQRWDERGFTVEFLASSLSGATRICPEHEQAISDWVLVS